MSAASDIRRLDPVLPEHADAWHGVVAASLAEDLPGVPPPTAQQVRGMLTGPGLGSRRHTWLVTAAGIGGGASGAVGAATLRLFDGPGQIHLAETDIHVRPGHRRQGVGARLLAAVVADAVADGRRSLVCAAPDDSPAGQFCRRHGFERALTLHHLLLSVTDTHQARLDELTAEPGRPGYRLVEWNGVVPDDLAGAYARAKGAMNDMPTGDMDYGTVAWDTDRIRAMAEVVVKRGDTLLTAAAVRGDEVAGFTETVIPGGTATRAVQYDTAVVPAHRGHGLGVWLKAHMLRRLRADHPVVAEVETDNAEDNAHMLAVNERLGFRRLRTTHEYQLGLPAAAQDHRH